MSSYKYQSYSKPPFNPAQSNQHHQSPAQQANAASIVNNSGNASSGGPQQQQQQQSQQQQQPGQPGRNTYVPHVAAVLTIQPPPQTPQQQQGQTSREQQHSNRLPPPPAQPHHSNQNAQQQQQSQAQQQHQQQQAASSQSQQSSNVSQQQAPQQQQQPQQLTPNNHSTSAQQTGNQPQVPHVQQQPTQPQGGVFMPPEYFYNAPGAGGPGGGARSHGPSHHGHGGHHGHGHNPMPVPFMISPGYPPNAYNANYGQYANPNGPSVPQPPGHHAPPQSQAVPTQPGVYDQMTPYSIAAAGAQPTPGGVQPSQSQVNLQYQPQAQFLTFAQQPGVPPAGPPGATWSNQQATGQAAALAALTQSQMAAVTAAQRQPPVDPYMQQQQQQQQQQQSQAPPNPNQHQHHSNQSNQPHPQPQNNTIHHPAHGPPYGHMPGPNQGQPNAIYIGQLPLNAQLQGNPHYGNYGPNLHQGHNAPQFVQAGNQQFVYLAPQPLAAQNVHPTMAPVSQPVIQQAPPMPLQQQPQQPQKRERKPILIVDPNTKQAVNFNTPNAASSSNSAAAAPPATTTPTPAAPATAASQPQPAAVPSTQPTNDIKQTTPTPVSNTPATTTPTTAPNAAPKGQQADIQAQVLRNLFKENNPPSTVATQPTPKPTDTNPPSASAETPAPTKTKTDNNTLPNDTNNNITTGKTVPAPNANNSNTNAAATATAPVTQPQAPKVMSYSSIAASAPKQPPPVVKAPQPVAKTPVEVTAPTTPATSKTVTPAVAEATTTSGVTQQPATQATPAPAAEVVDVKKQPQVQPQPVQPTPQQPAAPVAEETKPKPTVESAPKSNQTEPESKQPPAQQQQQPTPQQPAAEVVKKQATPPAAETTVTEPVKEPPPQVNVVPPPTTDATPSADSKSNFEFWTPENKEAKKRYGREFLLNLKEKKLSKVFPEVLKGLDILQDINKPVGGGPGSSNSYGNYTNSSYGGQSGGDQSQGQYNKGSMSKKQMGGKYPSMNKYNRGSVEGSRGGQNNQVIINIDKELELNKTENPYQIKRNVTEHEELLRDVRNILNKLTPNNLQKLTADLINLPINTAERLKDSIDIIFEKSIDEQVFSQTYAQLCKVLAQIKVPLQGEPGKFVNFRTMLLTKCQKEFDSDYAANISYDKLIEEAEACTDEAKKRELREIAEDKLIRAKRRSLGNIRFIGELFKLQMLTEGIMYDCIDRLLKQETDEENVECLCKLLTTIGKDLDKPGKKENENKMKDYFNRLDKISKKKDTVTARIRFMIMDVMDLRKNQWVPRRKDVNPRRIEEIRKEAEEEQLRQEAEYAKNKAEAKGMQQGTGQKGSQQGGKSGGGYQQQQQQQHVGKSTSMDADNFNQRGSKPQNGNMVNRISQVRQITTKNLDMVTLGPGGGGGGFAWNKPKPAAPTSDTNATSSSSSAASNSIPSSMSFTSGRISEDYNSDRRSSTSSGKGGRHHMGDQQQSSNTVTSRLSMDQNKANAYKQDRQFQNVKRMDSASNLNRSSDTSSQASSRDTSRSRQQSRDSSQNRPNMGSTNAVNSSSNSNNNLEPRRSYTDEEIKRKATNTIEEYSSNKNINEAMKDLEEFRPVNPTQYADFIQNLVLITLERNEHSRASLGQLFYHALTQQKIDQVSFVNGLKSVFELVEDMVIDIPKICTYLSQVVAHIFNPNVSVEFLTKASEPIHESTLCAEFISETLHTASNRLGHNTVANIFNASNLKIANFLKAVDNQAEFLEKNNLQWIVSSRERTQSASISAESYENRLNDILAKTTDENEEIFDKIENEFAQVDCESKLFIRALVISVCSTCLSDNKVDADLFKKRSPILNKFIAKKEELELEALFSVQALDHRMKHQPGIIRVLFDLLYDEDIIREDVFWAWKSNEREEGHVISVLALKTFFEWLSETESEQ